MSRYSPAVEAAKSMIDPVWLVLTFGITYVICHFCLDDGEKGIVKVLVFLVVGFTEFVSFYWYFQKHWREYDPMFKYMLPSYPRK